MSRISRKQNRRRVHHRIRKRIAGTPARPRLAVHFSHRHVYAQVIDDAAGRTLAAASTAEKDMDAGNAASVASATLVGELIARRSLDQKVESVVFDRGGHIFHGKVKALADAARQAGLKF